MRKQLTSSSLKLKLDSLRVGKGSLLPHFRYSALYLIRVEYLGASGLKDSLLPLIECHSS